MTKPGKQLPFILFFAVFVFVSGNVFARDLRKIVVATSKAEIPFFVEIAATSKSREIGLMHRRELPFDQGMLFVYPNAQLVQFWMRNTLIPLDILFLDKSGKIEYIHHNATPHSLQEIGPGMPIKMVLEINGGLSKTLAIRVGDRVVQDAKAQN